MNFFDLWAAVTFQNQVQCHAKSQTCLALFSQDPLPKIKTMAQIIVPKNPDVSAVHNVAPVCKVHLLRWRIQLLFLIFLFSSEIISQLCQDQQ